MSDYSKTRNERRKRKCWLESFAYSAALHGKHSARDHVDLLLSACLRGSTLDGVVELGDPRTVGRLQRPVVFLRTSHGVAGTGSAHVRLLSEVLLKSICNQTTVHLSTGNTVFTCTPINSVRQYQARGAKALTNLRIREQDASPAFSTSTASRLPTPKPSSHPPRSSSR